MTSHIIGRTARLATVATHSLAAALLVVLPAVVAAQHPAARQADPRWNAWIGCWTPATTVRVIGGSVTTAITCVVPTTDAATVDIVSIMNGKVLAHTPVTASGTRQPVARDGCSGWEQVTFSPDGRRVYRRDEFTCPGNARRSSNGLMAIDASGDWLDFEHVGALGAGGASGVGGVHAERYRDAGLPASVPSEIASAIQGRAMALSTARAAASAPISTADVRESLQQTDQNVVEAWLTARGQGFALDDKALVALADANVPGPVIDLMVALSYPKAFAVNSATGAGEPRQGATDASPALNRYPVDRGLYAYPYGAACYGWDSWACLNAYNEPWRYGYGSYGYGGYGYGSYGYGGYGGYGGYWYPTGVPVVVVTRGGGSGGRVQNGGGYTQGDGEGTGRSAIPRDAQPAPRGADRASDGGGRVSAPAAPAAAPAAAPRTAKPKP